MPTFALKKELLPRKHWLSVAKALQAVLLVLLLPRPLSLLALVPPLALLPLLLLPLWLLLPVVLLQEPCLLQDPLQVLCLLRVLPQVLCLLRVLLQVPCLHVAPLPRVLPQELSLHVVLHLQVLPLAPCPLEEPLLQALRLPTRSL